MGEGSVRPTVVDSLGVPDSANASEQAFIVVIYGEDLGKRIELGDEALAVGRVRECDLLLDDETVSRHHAEFEAEGRGEARQFLVRDLNSTNGTYVNGVAVRERVLADGDQVKIGHTIFKFLHGENIESNYHEVIYRLMTNDGLTQAHNRRFFEQQLAAELSRAARYKRPIALIMFDIDHFKNINDTKGHLAGDEVLRQLAETVQDNIRTEDLFARIGGEEFAILMPESRAEGAFILADRLREMIAQTAMKFEEVDNHVTCSFGIACLNEVQRGTTPQDLLEPADKRLYEAKARGRNCVVPAAHDTRNQEGSSD